MRRFLLLALLPLAACVDSGLETESAALSDGTPEAIGVLRFLNGPAADVATLDVDAALDARAARNIVAHVRGGDGVLGGGDDDPVDSIAELDAIAQVGPATIDRVLAYVESIGGVPRIEVEGVLLTEAEAAAVLAAANRASQGELDDAAGLDARAARNLVAARPLADLAAVAAVPYVGAGAIDRLRRWAPGWDGAPACDPALLQALRDCVEVEVMEQMVGKIDAVAACVADPGFAACAAQLEADYADLCAVPGDCAALGDGLRCQGVPNDGSSVLGVCADTRTQPGEGEHCTETIPCAAGTVCAGLAQWGFGSCVPDWMVGTFVGDLPVAVPAHAGATVGSATVVRGLASVPVDIAVEVDLAGADLGRLRLELTDCNGTTSVLWDGAAGGTPPARFVPGAGISGDEAVNGRWTLTAITLDDGAAGTITAWRLHLTSRWD